MPSKAQYTQNPTDKSYLTLECVPSPRVINMILPSHLDRGDGQIGRI